MMPPLLVNGKALHGNAKAGEGSFDHFPVKYLSLKFLILIAILAYEPTVAN